MIHAAMVGLGWWGKTLVESVQGTATTSSSWRARPARKSDDHRRLPTTQELTLHDSYEALLADPERRRGGAGDAALAAQPAGDRGGARPASTCSARSRSR